ncbi:MAG: PQQ-binding-like beta-propeller repeat protein [Ignavibacteria bacterium]|jgi:outer membrane protein assembly factor BamB/Icc-related predicted phosphoesterase|nr:PQQ-binding-like beta-propeller repeat protein [Ignavibacteria bacterium]
MKRFKLTILLTLLLSVLSFAQPFKFGWITDVHIGSPKAEEYLKQVVDDINKRSDIQFVIASGDIAEKGQSAELEQAKGILDGLKVKYYVIPGNHDTKWSDNGLTKFTELWGSSRFSFDFNGIRFIGMNSGIPWRGGGGHFAVEDLKWLDSELQKLDKKQEIIFCAHHPLNEEVDNWFEVTNRLRNYNIKLVMLGHGHVNKVFDFNGIPAVMGRSTLEDKKKTWGYTEVENAQDSLLCFEINRDSVPHLWASVSKKAELNVPQVDSAQFVNYNAEVKWQKDLNTTMVSPLVAWKNKIYAAATNGVVSCFSANGDLLWEIKTGGTIYSRPAVADNVLAVGTMQGDLITIDASKGNILQTIGIGEPVTSQILAMGYNGDKRLMSGAKPDTVFIVGTSKGRLLCYDINTLDPIWENTSASGMIETRPMYYENKLVYGSWDSYLYCIDARSGVLIWKWTGNKNFYYSPAACTPVTDGKNVYTVTPDKSVSAVDLLLGKKIWRSDTYPAWESIGISLDKQNLLIKGMNDKFFFLSTTKGKLVKELDLKFGLDTAPVTPIEINGNVIFGCKNGIVYQIDKSYNYRPLIFTGTARVHTVVPLKDNTFAASNMDGKIFVFSIKEGQQ